MSKSFSYSIPFNPFMWKLLGFFTIITLIGLFVPFDFMYRRSNINNHMLFVGGILLTMGTAMVAGLLYMKAEKSKKNPIGIQLHETMAVFPEGAANKIEVAYSSIGSVQAIGNKFNGDIVQIKSKDGSFNTLYIQGKGFESPFHYSEFLKIINIRKDLCRSKVSV